MQVLFWAMTCGLVSLASLSAAETPLVHVKFQSPSKPIQTVSGRILLKAEDGGVLLQERNGVLWTVTPVQLKSLQKSREVFKPFTHAQLSKQLQREFGKGFHVHTTKHYVICSDTGIAYSKWCGALFERLARAFRSHWKSSELKLHDPEFPLVVVIFKNRKDFARYAINDAGASVAQALGYFSMRTNRIALFDLTEGKGTGQTATEISRKILSSSFNVATVIHEATHQIAFNAGMHTRYADNPLWLTEGMAMYFETPDLRSRQGWRTAGRANPLRLRQFRDYLMKRRPPNALASLLSSDKRLIEAKTSADAYAEAWALTYFLVKTRKKAYRQYLAVIAKKPRLIWDSPEQRLQVFKKAFGSDLEKLDRAFVRYFRRGTTR